ncbi:hypothetical protein TNCV_2937581 [Trichonephila clavipes]|nr:hypothetical protein TNCV_2937581 [Trichonephila clavipes]
MKHHSNCVEGIADDPDSQEGGRQRRRTGDPSRSPTPYTSYLPNAWQRSFLSGVRQLQRDASAENFAKQLMDIGNGRMEIDESTDGRSPVPVTIAVFTFALLTGNGILWKECVVLKSTSVNITLGVHSLSALESFFVQ